VTAPAAIQRRPDLTDRRRWLNWLQGKFPAVGFLLTGQWVAVVGSTNRCSTPTAYELAEQLREAARRGRIPHLPDILPARRLGVL
jgi:hypothetical protein